jgi:hypothetical protein
MLAGTSPSTTCDLSQAAITIGQPTQSDTSNLEALRAYALAELIDEFRLRVSLPVIGINANSPDDRRRADS